MPRILICAFAFLLCPVLQAAANGQVPLSPQESQKIAPLIDSHSPNSLKCRVERSNPTIDFAFRFVTGYAAFCGLSQFEGKRTSLSAYVRITPQGKPAVLFGSLYVVPGIPEPAEMHGKDAPDLTKSDIAPSGAFGLGRGKYSFDLLLTDDRKRVFRKHWQLRAATHRSERGVAFVIPPLTVEPLDDTLWQTTSSEKPGKLRLSLLVDAAPLDPYRSNLDASDRALLLEGIYSVLRQTPHAAVHLVAFSMDQQRELFRSDDFDSTAFQKLAHTLEGSELASISVTALKGRSSPLFLIALANQELAAERADAIIFVGPNVLMDTQVTGAVLSEKKATSPSLFYFEYSPWFRGDDDRAAFPDTISSLVKEGGGKVFVIHSPAQFDESIDKMLVQLKAE